MKILITGACGFIGCHSVEKFISLGHEVILLDNQSRPGSEINLQWLKSRHELQVYNIDVRNRSKLNGLVREHSDIDAVVHLAAQVAVTTSVSDPETDFEINAGGTFNLLEAVRKYAKKSPTILFSSSNKVYGGLHDTDVKINNERWEFGNRPDGIDERERLDFHSPYGCSKGAADQYVRDYSRIYDMSTVVLRQSCIYGTRQFGVEDQGWVAWFSIAAALDKEVTIYGDGKQIRDLLWVDDLTDLYALAIDKIDDCRGEVFNVGGGVNNTLSLLELFNWIENRTGKGLEHKLAEERPGDQKVFVANNNKLKSSLGWEPKTPVSSGLEQLYAWIDSNRNLFH